MCQKPTGADVDPPVQASLDQVEHFNLAKAVTTD
jgi:hypothetical protein